MSLGAPVATLIGAVSQKLLGLSLTNPFLDNWWATRHGSLCFLLATWDWDLRGWAIFKHGLASWLGDLGTLLNTFELLDAGALWRVQGPLSGWELVE